MREYITTDKIDVQYFRGNDLLATLKTAITKYGADNVLLAAKEEMEYGGSYISCYLACKRPMTTEEQEKAMALEKQTQQRQEAYDKQQYERLKAKYG